MFYRREMTARRLGTMTALAWLIALAVTVPYLYWFFRPPHGSDRVNAHVAATVCYQIDFETGPVPLSFDFAMLFSVYATTTIVLIGLSVGVLVAARRRLNAAGYRPKPPLRVLLLCGGVSARRSDRRRGGRDVSWNVADNTSASITCTNVDSPPCVRTPSDYNSQITEGTYHGMRRIG